MNLDINHNFFVNFNSINPELRLRGSSPTPGVSDVGSIRWLNDKTRYVFRDHRKKDMNLIESEMKIQSSKDIRLEELDRKIDSITKGLSRPYFNKILKELSRSNLENAVIICNYIIAEQIEIHIQNSTSKIKVLTWLSNHFQDQKSFKDLTKYNILDFLN